MGLAEEFGESLAKDIAAYLKPDLIAELKAAGAAVAAEIEKLGPVIQTAVLPLIETEIKNAGATVDRDLPGMVNAAAASAAKEVTDAVLAPINAALSPLENLVNNFPHL